uniref:NADH dehydrogenase subunit 4L n=1 Tax=Anodonta anatina TaxID=143294 RepID=A0A023I1E6_ANOAN|nr:NADH dehydrogenase subunit 4L [Anodonta anatina]AGS17943.1 NADH dehydrogenase subunit 4L [Anodonta anatina]
MKTFIKQLKTFNSKEETIIKGSEVCKGGDCFFEGFEVNSDEGSVIVNDFKLRKDEEKVISEEMVGIKDFSAYEDNLEIFTGGFEAYSGELESLVEGFDFFGMFILSMCCLLLQLHSLFSILLSLEVIGLVMCFNFVCSFIHAQWVSSFVLVFLCFEVSIISVLLSLMVGFVKGTGGDYVGVISSSRDF